MQLPWPGSAVRWAMGLGPKLQLALSGTLVEGPEGLPLYFDSRPNQKLSYRPSVVLCDEYGDQTHFVISFTSMPKALAARPNRKKADVLLHYMDFCRMMRWGVLEAEGSREYFSEANAFTPEQADERLRQFIEGIISIRTDFWNRGLERDAIRSVLDESDHPLLDSLHDSYFQAIKQIDPKDEGIPPEPLPDFQVVKQVYNDLLRINKVTYLLVHSALRPELDNLDDGAAGVPHPK